MSGYGSEFSSPWDPRPAAQKVGKTVRKHPFPTGAVTTLAVAAGYQRHQERKFEDSLGVERGTFNSFTRQGRANRKDYLQKNIHNQEALKRFR